MNKKYLVHIYYENFSSSEDVMMKLVHKGGGVNQILLKNEEEVCIALEAGEYECICEQDEFVYCVNGELQLDGLFYLNNDMYIVCLKQSMVGVGKICIQLDHCDEEKYICLKSKEYVERLCVNEKNHYQCCFENLLNGEYEVYVEDDLQHTYYVNGKIVDQAIIRIEYNMHVIQIDQHDSGKVFVKLQHRQSDGQCIVPASGQQFVFILKNKQYEQEYRLDTSNHFKLCFDHLPKGMYELQPVDDKEYHITYKINDQKVEDCCFKLANDSIDIVIECELQQDECELDVYYNVYNHKFMKPMAEERINFVLEHEGKKKEYELNQNNNWHVTLCDLDDGAYDLYAIGIDGLMYYFVDGSFVRNCASFTCVSGDNRVIGIIRNEETSDFGSIIFRKRMLNEDASLMMPVQACYEIDVVGEQGNYHFTLNEQNGYEYCLKDVLFGKYEIIEKNASPFFMYNNKAITKENSISITSNIENEVVILNKK